MTSSRAPTEQLGLGELPAIPTVSLSPTATDAHTALIVVSVVDVGRLTEPALTTALRLGGTAVPVAAERDPDATIALDTRMKNGHHVPVLLVGGEPRRRRDQIRHNQRQLVLAAALRSRTDAVVATLFLRLT